MINIKYTRIISKSIKVEILKALQICNSHVQITKDRNEDGSLDKERAKTDLSSISLNLDF